MLFNTPEHIYRNAYAIGPACWAVLHGVSHTVSHTYCAQMRCQRGRRSLLPALSRLAEVDALLPEHSPTRRGSVHGVERRGVRPLALYADDDGIGNGSEEWCR